MFLTRSQRLPRSSQFYLKLSRLLFNDATKILSSDTVASIPSDTNFVDYIWKDQKQFENKTAFTCGVSGRSLTYGQAYAAIDRLSVNLPAEFGLQSEDNIALLLPNTPEYAIAFFAAASAGIVSSLINPLYTSSELWKLLAHSKAKVIITIPPLLDTVQEAMAKLPGGGLPVVLVGGDGSQKDTVDFHSLVGKSTRAVRRLDKASPQADIALPFSSGTTGVPKGVVISHHNLVAQAETMLHAIPDYKTEPRSTVAVIPFFHIYGLSMFMGFSLRRRMHVVSLPKFDPSTFLNALKTYKPSHLFLVPPLVQHMSRSPQITPDVMENLKLICTGAAPITGQIVEEFLQKSKQIKPVFMNGKLFF
ncbi:Hypothetical predicted protein [Cloeon dipterum]|uniref:AMP-dependent synthetase/ligase domain-containing protein n=1 Tax=Cloeon dipterum TaxID=197152 RepID=A0A8S1BUF4_9INSE|nr:Hypothetical predicted protein [Cloeon dipterum]